MFLPYFENPQKNNTTCMKSQQATTLVTPIQVRSLCFVSTPVTNHSVIARLAFRPNYSRIVDYTEVIASRAFSPADYLQAHHAIHKLASGLQARATSRRTA
jgi:hypothetical protein